MPDKNPNTQRWGGPGSSHEDATRDPPEKKGETATDVSTNARVSRVSGGGGERDEKHSHDDAVRSSKTEPGAPENRRANRSRRAKAREADGTAERAPEAAADEAATGAFINVHTDENLKGYGDVASRVENEVGEELERFRDQLTSIEVFISQGSAQGAGAAGDGRCTIEARPRRRKPVAVSTEGKDVMQAVRVAISKVSRVLDQRFSKRKDHKGQETIRTGIV